MIYLPDKEIRVAYLYPDLMNLYGDRGNIIALKQRSVWHGIDIRVDRIDIGQQFKAGDYDFLFIGGGQDREQKKIAYDLVNVKAEAINQAFNDHCVILTICGGYQLLGSYYEISDSERLPGLGIFPAWTKSGQQRLICNTVINTVFSGRERKLVGFVNHGGQTYLNEGAIPLGKVLAGEGNSLNVEHEGCIINCAYGTYLHGALLPKNPWFADLLLQQALEHRGISWEIEELDDQIEQKAHEDAVNLALRSSGKRS